MAGLRSVLEQVASSAAAADSVSRERVEKGKGERERKRENEMEKEKKSLRQIEDSFSTHGESSGMGKYKYFAQFTI